MRVLFLTDPAPDYLADQIYTGLCRILGADAVIDFPYKLPYHDPHHKATFLPQNDARRYETEEVRALLSQRKIDLVILSSPRAGVVRTLETLGGQYLPPRVLLDGEDDDRIRPEPFDRLGCALYFKREYPNRSVHPMMKWLSMRRSNGMEGRIHPLSFSVILDTVPADNGPMERDVDVSYAGRVSHRKRIQAVRMLQQTSDIRFEGGVYAETTDRKSKLAAGRWEILAAKLCGDPYVQETERGRKLPPAEYYALLGRSKIGLSIRGGGFDTLRYWEIVASRALLVSERPDIVIPNNFEHLTHAVFCNPDLSDLVSLVRRFAREDVVRQDMIDRAYRHLLKFHTCERRAEQLLAVCRRAL